MRPIAVRLSTAAATAGAILVLLTSVASAHVGTSIDSVPAGGRTALGLTIGHGCDDSPTTQVAVQIPEGVNDATAFAKPGWTIVSEKQTLETPTASPHGDPVTERVAVITFTAAGGNALPTELRDVFTINFSAPDTPGQTLYFKTVQSCDVGENAWIQEYDGTGDEPDSPAPSIAVADAEPEEDAHGAAEPEEDAEEAAKPTGDANASDDDDGDTLAIAALLVGAVGVGIGGVALLRATRAN